jgi:ubiquinone/menaquinone biosynthesis C-methylase UbiE
LDEENDKEKDIEVQRANLEAWDQHASYWQRHVSEIDRKKMSLKTGEYLRIFSIIEKISGNFKKKTIADIGCGGGTEMDSMFLRKCGHLTGVDISKEMLRTFLSNARAQNSREKLSLVQSSAEQLPFKDKAFDVGAVFHALHHCPRPERVIAEIVRTCEDLVLLEPNRASAMHRIAHFANSVRKGRFSVTKFSEGLVELRASGFTVMELLGWLTEARFAGLDSKQEFVRTVGLVPNWFPLPHFIVSILLRLELLMTIMPIAKWQLGGILLITHK